MFGVLEFFVVFEREGGNVGLFLDVDLEDDFVVVKDW